MKTTIELAREAGFKEHNGMVYVTTINDDCAKEIEHLVALVRADEREACAKVCDEEYFAYVAADAIRNRGNT